MYPKRHFQLKNISFFKSPGNSHSHHISVNSNQIMRQISPEGKTPQEKKSSMCFPTVSDRALSNSTSHSKRKISKISFKKNYLEGQTPKSNSKGSDDLPSSLNKKCSNQIIFAKCNLYSNLSNQIRVNSNKSKHIKSFSDISYEGDKSIKSTNNNMRNNIRLVLEKQMNNPSSLKSTSASKESNNNTNSIKIVKMYTTNNQSGSNEADDIDTPEELHYYYIKTLQSGKIAETKF